MFTPPLASVKRGRRWVHIAHPGFKPDRPRAIDRYIDYFAGATETLAKSDDDNCGEAFLETLA
jgi:hypothetical protein